MIQNLFEQMRVFITLRKILFYLFILKFILSLAAGNFNFKLTFVLKKITVYRKRFPSYKDYLDKFILRNSLN